MPSPPHITRLDPARYAPAGGTQGFNTILTLLAVTGGLAAVLIGATAGAQDVESGVFRSLVSTGQSRIRIAIVRIPGALLMLLPMLAIGFATEVIATYALAGGIPTPYADYVLVGFGWLMATAILDLTVALGLAALLRARATAIGVMIAWELAGTQLVERISAFGGLEDWSRRSASTASCRTRPTPCRSAAGTR